jgi:hypothetical protein
MMEQIKGAIAGDTRSFLDFKEMVNSKMGQRVQFGFICPQRSFIKT